MPEANDTNRGGGWIRLLITSGVVVALITVIGGIAVAWINTHPVEPAPTPTSVVVATSTATSAQSPTTASTTPIATTITENRSIPCVGSCPVMIVLDTVVIDTSERNMRWTFTLSSGPGCNDGELDLYLEDSSGTKYQAGGDVGPSNPTWAIASGQSFNVIALFAGLNPAQGVAYQLYTGISGFCHGAYQTESFTF